MTEVYLWMPSALSPSSDHSSLLPLEFASLATPSSLHRSWTCHGIHEAVVDQLHTKYQVEEGMTDKILGLHDSHSRITMHARCVGFHQD